MIKRLLLAASVLGFMAVALGALGAHKLKEIISATNLDIFEKGVTYQFYHVSAMIAAAILLHLYGNKRFYHAGMFFFAGIICFSGSLYLLALRDVYVTGANQFSDIIPTVIIGPITPIGGLLFLTGWVLLLSGVLKIKS
ncbi:MAG: DUF423 domain-containing protein [Bacteroidia bacterium]